MGYVVWPAASDVSVHFSADREGSGRLVVHTTGETYELAYNTRAVPALISSAADSETPIAAAVWGGNQ
jgi:hypothetical protein